jgi:hypothetical protein
MAGAQSARTDPPSQPVPQNGDRSGRTLRWRYRRDGEVLTCALALTSDSSAYQLQVYPARSPAGLLSELFDDAISAFQRQVTIERMLLEEGWTLEQFEHVVDERPGKESDFTRKSA